MNRSFDMPAISQLLNPLTEAGRAALDAVITRQAQIIAYIDDYKLLMIATPAMFPLLAVHEDGWWQREHTTWNRSWKQRECTP